MGRQSTHHHADSTPHCTAGRRPPQRRVQPGFLGKLQWEEAHRSTLVCSGPINSSLVCTTSQKRASQGTAAERNKALVASTAGERAGTRKTTPIPTSQPPVSVLPFTMKTVLCYVTHKAEGHHTAPGAHDVPQKNSFRHPNGRPRECPKEARGAFW